MSRSSLSSGDMVIADSSWGSRVPTWCGDRAGDVPRCVAIVNALATRRATGVLPGVCLRPWPRNDFVRRVAVGVVCCAGADAVVPAVPTDRCEPDPDPGDDMDGGKVSTALPVLVSWR